MKIKDPTEVIKLTDNNFQIAIHKTANIILNGGIAVIPTETVYGIAASIYNENGINKIFEAKQRPSDNPLIVHISKLEQLEELIDDINEVSKKMIDHFWPGPLTLIFKAKNRLNRNITGGLDTVAVRMPDNAFTLALIDITGPIAAPSANISGKPSGTEISDIFEELNDKVDIIIDEGLSKCGLESTVINPLINPPVILRKGSIPKESIEKIIGKVVYATKQTANISPGTKYKHYAPSVNMTYIKKIDNPYNFNIIINTLSREKKIGVINFGLEINDNLQNIYIENLDNNPLSAMKLFYKALRKLDKTVDEIIILPLPEHEGLWASIEDRIERGANKIVPVI